MIKVLVVQATRLACSLTATLLRDEPDIKMVGWAITVEEALEKAPRANLILVDTSLENDSALKITKQLAKSYPEIDVLVFGLPEKPELVLRYVEAGANGYVAEELEAKDLLDSIRAVHNNEALISPQMAAQLMDRINELAVACLDIESIQAELEALTPRQREALELIADGKSNQEISDSLDIEIGTVKNHVHNILKKLDVNSRYEAAALYNKQKEFEDVTPE
ncbi:MAG: response regulator transcription factor [Anaerolineales bacterium]|nr:response regulator transcription factor [Anaerolineales bacterium]